MKSILTYGWGSFLVAALIFYLCCLATPSDVPDVEIPHMDKVVHFFMFFGLSLVASVQYIYLRDGHIIIFKLVVFAFLLPILYGGAIELMQGFFFNREADWFDFLADMSGSLAVLPIALIVRKEIMKRQLY